MRINHCAIACALTLGVTSGGLVGDRAVAAGVEAQPFGETDGKNVSLFTLTNGNGQIAKIITYGGIVTELARAGQKRQARRRRPRLRQHRRLPRRHPYFGATSAAAATASPRGSSRSTARSTRSPRTTARTTLHGGKGLRQEGLEGRAVGARRRPGAEASPNTQPRRRGRLSGTSRRDGRLHADQRQRTRIDYRDHRQDDTVNIATTLTSTCAAHAGRPSSITS